MEDYSIRCKLSRLSQVGSVLDYQIEFEKLSSKVTETHEQILVSIFIFGLQPDIRWDLERNRPTALKEAFASARLQESRLEVLRLARNKIIEELADSDETGEIEAGTDMKMEEESLAPIFIPARSVEATELNAPLHHPPIMNPVIFLERVPMSKLSSISNIGIHIELFTHEEMKTPVGSPKGPEPAMITVAAEPEDSPSNEKEETPTVVLLCKEDVFGHWWKDVVLEVWRRWVIFGLYALEEVYKDLLNLHLEDKVIFKGGGVDTSFVN